MLLLTHPNSFVQLCHTHTHTNSSHFPVSGPEWVPWLQRFCSRHQNGHLSSVSRPLCPPLPPVDTYSPLQLCCSISHPTHAAMGCWLYLATVMVNLVQMRDCAVWCLWLASNAMNRDQHTHTLAVMILCLTKSGVREVSFMKLVQNLMHRCTHYSSIL